eukprot:TRINITY_DN31536_c0_g1_i2.p1 TRINITY_DN31536_c0_g1~~TRINITY_DN31536_c0_g1_i2.p1  ORF type:complete len:451 (-),score=74.55 TRINITY_DN31536_c0_g1_i2:134-1450(-)
MYVGENSERHGRQSGSQRLFPLLAIGVASCSAWHPRAFVATAPQRASSSRIKAARSSFPSAPVTMTDFTGNCRTAVAGLCAVATALASVGHRRSNTKRFFLGGNSSEAEKTDSKKGGQVQQLIGMKGASDEEVPLWKIRLQLCKPVTWPPLLFGVVAGTCASGNFDWSTATGEMYAKLALTMFLSGPVLVGYTQTLNDWYDKDLDAINEPYRPIPSGKISEKEVWEQIIFLGVLGVFLAGVIDFWQGHSFPAVSLVAIIGVFTAYIYSAPPLKLKQNWISGCYSLGASYVALPWWAGQCAFGQGTSGGVTTEVILLTLFYSIAAVGIAIVNDFKSVEGDRKLGLSSAPVVFGIDTAKYMAPAIKDGIQLCIVAYLYSIGCTEYAITLFLLILPQVYFAKTLFIENPLENDVKYQGASLPFFSIGTIVTASAIGISPLH